MPSGKYTSYTSTREVKSRPWKVHPIWRGIGCLMLILMPIVAFLAAYLLVDQDIVTTLKIPYPPEFSVTLITIPFLGFNYNVNWMTLILTGLLTLIGFAGIMIFYSVMYSALGPPRYGPLDAPPKRYKKKKKLKQKR
jgi:hypothetical protein